MKEEVFISDGKGVIHLKGDCTTTILYLKKNPKLISFSAEVGTVWRYNIGTEITEQIIENNYQYETFVRKGNLVETEKLSSQCKHITQLLTNGYYELNYCEFPWSLKPMPVSQQNSKKKCLNNYGGSPSIIATQSFSDKSIIEKYKSEIINGSKPIVVLIKLKDSWAIFILDGHHKLQAYKELKVNPRALLITKLDAKTVDEDLAIQEMIALGMTDKEILGVFKKEQSNKYYEENFFSGYKESLDFYFKSVENKV